MEIKAGDYKVITHNSQPVGIIKGYQDGPNVSYLAILPHDMLRFTKDSQLSSLAAPFGHYSDALRYITDNLFARKRQFEREQREAYKVKSRVLSDKTRQYYVLTPDSRQVLTGNLYRENGGYKNDCISGWWPSISEMKESLITAAINQGY